MKSSPIIIMMCIYYKNDENGPYQSYIGNPVTVGTKMTCAKPYASWYVGDSFYAVNPMFTPIPSYFRLICAKRSVSGEKGYNTMSIVSNYDPFNIDDDCIYFLTWTQPTPYTTPLYVYESGNGILVSFEKKEMKEAFLSPLFVLTDKPRKNTIFTGERKWFTVHDDAIQFRFRDDNGRCIPEPGGSTLQECTLKNSLQMKKPLSLLDILNKEKDDEGGKNIFNKVSVFIITVLIVIMFGSLIVVLYVKK